MAWERYIFPDAEVCGVLALVFIVAAFRFRHRLAASAPAAAVFLVLLLVPVLTGIARIYKPAADGAFIGAFAVEAYAMMLGLVLPMPVLLLFMERSRRQWKICRFRDKIDDLRGWKNPTAARRIRSLMRRLGRLGICDFDLTRCHLRRLNLSGMVFTGARMVPI